MPTVVPAKQVCRFCCNDGERYIPCVDAEACAAGVPARPAGSKYALVLTQVGRPGDKFLRYIEAMRASIRGNGTDILLIMPSEDVHRYLTVGHRKLLEAHGVQLMEVPWALPPDMLFRPKGGWCGRQDLVRLHALSLPGYDAVLYYDSDVEVWGDLTPLLRCAAGGRLLTTNGGIGEPVNIGFFAVRPDPRLMQAARIFAQRADFDYAKGGWAGCGFVPSGTKFVGAECGQGFFHTLFYKRKCKMAQLALKEAGLDNSGYQFGQVDRCIWNYQTSFQCSANFNCSRVRAHHKPPRPGSDPKECLKRGDKYVPPEGQRKKSR